MDWPILKLWNKSQKVTTKLEMFREKKGSKCSEKKGLQVFHLIDLNYVHQELDSLFMLFKTT